MRKYLFVFVFFLLAIGVYSSLFRPSEPPMEPAPKSAFCPGSDQVLALRISPYEASGKTTPANRLLLTSIMQLVPQQRRPEHLRLRPEDITAVSMGPMEDERAREQVTAALSASSEVLALAGDHDAARAALRHLMDVLVAYEGAENPETAKDATVDLFDVALAMAKHGDTACARQFADYISEHKNVYAAKTNENYVDVFLVKLLNASGDRQAAESLLKKLFQQDLASLKADPTQTRRFASTNYLAQSLGMHDIGNYYVIIARARLEDEARKEEFMETVNALRYRGERTTSRRPPRTDLANLDRRLQTAASTQRAFLRGSTYGAIIEGLAEPLQAQPKAAEDALQRIREDIANDPELTDDPLAVLYIVEALTRIGKFEIAEDLLQRADRQDAAKGGPYGPALNAATALVASRVAVPYLDRFDDVGVGLIDPTLATGQTTVGPWGIGSWNTGFHLKDGRLF